MDWVFLLASREPLRVGPTSPAVPALLFRETDISSKCRPSVGARGAEWLLPMLSAQVACRPLNSFGLLRPHDQRASDLGHFGLVRCLCVPFRCTGIIQKGVETADGPSDRCGMGVGCCQQFIEFIQAPRTGVTLAQRRSINMAGEQKVAAGSTNREHTVYTMVSWR